MAVKKFKRRPNKKAQKPQRDVVVRDEIPMFEEKPRYNTVLMLSSEQAKMLLDHLVESVKSHSGVLSEIIYQLRK